MGVLNDIRTQVRNHLEADAFFAGIEILEESRGDIVSAVETALAETGLCVILVTPVASKSGAQVPYGHLDRIVCVARCCKNAALDTSGIQASDIAEKVFSLCDGVLLDEAQQLRLTVPEDAIQLAEASGTQDQPLVAYDVPIVTQAAFPVTWPVVAAPVITEADGTLTLTCATVGAAIYYTLDGSRPGPANGMLYTAPFVPDSGLRLRARAGRWGALASPLTELNPT